MADRLCALVVAHGAAAETVAAIGALAASEGTDAFRVHVLDNSVDDEVADAMSRAFPGVESGPVRSGAVELLLTRLENRGFGAALNVGARQAVREGFALLLVLNPDCEVSQRTVAELAARSERPGDVVGAPVLDASPSPRVERFGGARHSRWTSRNVPVGHGLALSEAVARTRALEAEVVVPTGACMLLRSADLEAAGWFDEDLFLYYEEVALMARLRGAGLVPRVRVAAAGAVVHVGGASTGSTDRQSALTRFHASRSAVIVARKYDGWTVPVVVAARVLLALRELVRDPGSARAVTAGLIAGLRAPLERPVS